MVSKCEIKSCIHWRDSDNLYCQDLYINACLFCCFKSGCEGQCDYVKKTTELMLTTVPKECEVYDD